MSISEKRLQELQNIPDCAIDTSDIPELDDNFWENANFSQSQQMAEVLEKIAELNPFADIDPKILQQETRQDRPLP